MPEAQCGRSASSRVSPVFTKTFCSAQASMRARPRLALLYSSPHAHAANALVAGKSRVKGPWRGGCDLTARHPRKAPATSHQPAGSRPEKGPAGCLSRMPCHQPAGLRDLMRLGMQRPA